MAENLKITMPMVSKNPIPQYKQSTHPTVPFNIDDVIRAPNIVQKQRHADNNTAIDTREEPQVVLSNHIKAPDVIISFLKNIFTITDMTELLTENSSVFAQEITKLLNLLLISPEDIKSEMILQEYSSTAFKGELFDLLRNLVQKKASPPIKSAVVELLKALNEVFAKSDITESVSASLKFLSEEFAPDKSLSEKLWHLSNEFLKENSTENLENLKEITIAALNEIDESILLSPKTVKILPLVAYNLSRIKGSVDLIHNFAANLIEHLDCDEEKAEFLAKLKDYLIDTGEPNSDKGASKVMSALTEILEKQMQGFDSPLPLYGGMGKTIQSLLSSPCIFTPLLHYIIPVGFANVKSFAEIWIDPDDAEGRENEGADLSENIHAFAAFDIEGIGEFEGEFFLRRGVISLSLYYPPEYSNEFSGLYRVLTDIILKSNYKPGDIEVRKLKRKRTLPDVFKSLTYKRMGVDVRV